MFAFLLNLLLHFDRIHAVDLHHQVESLVFFFDLTLYLLLLYQLGVADRVHFDVQNQLVEF